MVDIFRRPRLTVTQNVLTFRKSYSLVIGYSLVQFSNSSDRDHVLSL